MEDVKVKKRFLILMVLIFLAFSVTVAYAQSVYISTDQPNTTVTQNDYVVADTSYNPNSYLTAVKVAWYCYADDILKIKYYDFNYSPLGEHTITPTAAGIYTDTPPSGAYFAKLEMTSGTETGTRYFWYLEVTNNWGNTAYFDSPITNTGLIGGGGGSGGGGTPTTDQKLDAIISALWTINSNLDPEISQILGQLQLIKSNLDYTNFKLSELYLMTSDNFQMVLNELYTANSTLNDIKSNTDDIKDTLNSLYDYITTPKYPDVYIPSLNISPVQQPTIPERNKKSPYQYDWIGVNMPQDTESPGPLPQIPEPSIMPHEDPRQQDQPITSEEVRIRENPLSQQNPLSRQEPLPQTPRDMQSPLQPNDPLPPQNPLQAQSPLQQQTPLTPQAPLQPNPPLR